jgi:hypothetical protein
MNFHYIKIYFSIGNDTNLLYESIILDVNRDLF